MNKHIIVSIVVILLSVVFSAQAADNKQGKKNKVAMKCHVELLGGRDVVHHMVIREKRIPNLAEKLTGKKISVVGQKKKQRIYKVNQCIKESETFASSAATHIESTSVYD